MLDCENLWLPAFDGGTLTLDPMKGGGFGGGGKSEVGDLEAAFARGGGGGGAVL